MTHRIAIRVYYEDTDLAGVVYYANYLRFIERGRSEALRDIGIDQAALKRDRGLVFVVRSLGIDYLAPARFDDMLEVRTRVVNLKGASVEMGQEVWRSADRLVRASVTVACMDGAGRPQRLPADVRTGLSALITAD
ncbi:MAG TPA: tol-pal system-associated acyl-CoA thioesterase [Thermohalobaculum sp.]|nr:tol-pal system-associated acyl-CoA thioesterase [Thermohalobaculum sp.]